MVCLHEENPVRVTVRDTVLMSGKKQSYINLTPTKTIDSIFNEVSKDFNYGSDDIELVLQRRDGNTVSETIFFLGHKELGMWKVYVHLFRADDSQ